MPTALVDALLTRGSAAIELLLEDDVAFHSPVRSYAGRDEVSRLLAYASGVLPDLEVQRELSQGSDTVTFLAGRIDDRPVEVMVYERCARDGRVAEITLMLRPLKSLLIVVERMAAALAA
jgi:hypothetical protein